MECYSSSLIIMMTCSLLSVDSKSDSDDETHRATSGVYVIII